MEYMYKGLSHIGIMTDDPKGCAQFYIDKLNFRHFHYVNRGTVEIYMVENGNLILEFVGRKTTDQAGVIDHICIEVVDIDKTVEDLKAKGVKFESEKANVMEGFYPFPCKNIFFRGPANERVELFDFSNN